MDHRVQVSEGFSDALRLHGVAGIFIDPEGSIISSSNHLRISARRATALHHTHLRDDVFETVATSLAEGVGVSTTARIQGVDKKTVLLVLAKSAVHVAKINHSLLRNLVVSECQLDEMWSFIGKKEKNLVCRLLHNWKSRRGFGEDCPYQSCARTSATMNSRPQ